MVTGLRPVPAECGAYRAFREVACNRILHFRFNRIQTHALIADRARLGNHKLHQHPAQARAAIVRPHVKPLHFDSLPLGGP